MHKKDDDMKKENPHIGSTLNEFLKEEGILEKTRAAAIKETLAWQVSRSVTSKS